MSEKTQIWKSIKVSLIAVNKVINNFFPSFPPSFRPSLQDNHFSKNSKNSFLRKVKIPSLSFSFFGERINEEGFIDTVGGTGPGNQ